MKKNKVRWLVCLFLIGLSMLLVWFYNGFDLGLDLKGGQRYVLAIDETKLESLIRDKYKNDEEIEEAELATRVDFEMDEASKQILTVIRNRIDQQGTREPNIIEQKSGGERRIIVELPGLTPDEAEDVEELIVRQAILEFRGVDLDNDTMIEKILNGEDKLIGYKTISIKNGENAQTFLVHWSKDDWVADAEACETVGLDPAIIDSVWRDKERSFSDRAIQAKWSALTRAHGDSAISELLMERSVEKSTVVYSPVYVEVKPEMGGENIQSARVDSQFGETKVYVSFKGDGRDQFASVTADFAPGGARNSSSSSVGRRLAVVLDGTIYSAPTINEKIGGGSAEISGSFDASEANQLSMVLRSGAFPAPIEIAAKSTISPTLGKEAINSSIVALIIGGALILLFMLFYYRVAGGVVNVALAVDILLLPLGMFLAGGFLSIFVSQPGTSSTGLPVLTLPGIAGLVLTIGMAVDANVLIFERMREEQAAGKRFSNVVAGGFDKAYSTILDANVTTMIVAIILYIFGSGPIRGFAVTLTAGILVSVYTALVFTRLVFDFLATKKDRKPLSMVSAVKATSIDFLGKRKIAAICSIALIVITWAMLITKGTENLGIDFTGGRSVTLAAPADVMPSVQDVRSKLDAAGIKGAGILRNQSASAELLDLRVRYGTSNLVETVQAAYPNVPFELQANDEIGPSIGKDLATKGAWAMFFALLGIVIYISFRFEFAFALGSIVALVHDVLITIGVFCLLGFELSGPIIAALLTVVGYSVNDTIVVFDRIREDWGLDKQTNRESLANRAINRTLSRTLLTSLTTLLTVVILLVFGGGAIREFALTLTIGVLIGTYSSVFVATPVMLWIRSRSSEDTTPATSKTAKATA